MVDDQLLLVRKHWVQLAYVAFQLTTTVSALEPLFAFLSYVLVSAESILYKIPGSNIIARYVKSLHQSDPGRTMFEIFWHSSPFVHFFNSIHSRGQRRETLHSFF